MKEVAAEAVKVHFNKKGARNMPCKDGCDEVLYSLLGSALMGLKK